jgi:hypothetical protein
MIETFYGQLSLDKEEVDTLERQKVTLQELFNTCRLPGTDYVDEDGGWIEWRGEDPEAVARQASVLREAVAKVLTKSRSIICPECGGEIIILDVDTRLTRVYQQTPNGLWDLRERVEHQENPVCVIRCYSCDAELPDYVDVQKLLSVSDLSLSYAEKEV